MPNHVKNIIKMCGIAEKNDLFIVYRDDEKNSERAEFDFNKLIPMPDGLNDVLSPTEDDIKVVREYIRRYLTSLPLIYTPPAPFESGLDEQKKQQVRNGLKALSYLLECGFTDWYNWSRVNWGTKWNAYYTEIVDNDTISFCTAWTDPTPIIRALAEKYPDATIDHWWADEDRGYNTGHRRYENGEWLEDEYEGGSEEANANAAFCWGKEKEVDE